DALPPRLAHAVRLFERAQSDARTRPAAAVVRDAVVRSGWMARLEREGAAGMARAANVLKAVRLIEGIESERHLGLASTARAFADELAAGCKEAPGALSGASGDVVKIMTIHASKGLEFPIVALADFADVSAPRGKLVVEACGPVARASLAPGRRWTGSHSSRSVAAGPSPKTAGKTRTLPPRHLHRRGRSFADVFPGGIAAPRSSSGRRRSWRRPAASSTWA
ncbi:MAG: 3'-5' exonuclease, partial [Eggerthellaceae bacterium]